jgi:hypothetical protein
MRGANLQGRFNIDYEAKRIYEGIKEDLQHPVGVEVSWFRWNEQWAEDNAVTVKDPIYDVSNSGFLKGRRWVVPFSMPAISAQLVRGSNEMNERGFYVVDTLHISLNVGDVERMVPTMLTDSESHIKDRIVYRGKVFTPTRVLPRGHFGYRWSVVTIECLQVNSDELVNDPQFQYYALKGTQDMRPRAELGYGFGGYGEESYGL